MFTYETGSFIVDSTGEVEVDFLYDGGSFRGELGVFSLNGMDDLEPGSTEFILEAVTRAESDSPQGYSLINDRTEGARFNANLGYEKNFNSGTYQGVKTLTMNPSDEVGFVFAPKNSFATTLENADNILESDAVPIVSIPEANIDESFLDGAQFVSADSNGTIGVTDLPVNRSNRDYNDLIYQIQGLEGNLPPIEDLINPELDWRNQPIGEELFNYTENQFSPTEDLTPPTEDLTPPTEDLTPPAEDLTPPAEDLTPPTEETRIRGTFAVGEDGEVTVDYLFDGGFFQGEVGIFSLEDLNPEDFGSTEFVAEVIDRVSSNSNQGHIVITDQEEGAKYNSDLPWEADLNLGEYSGSTTFALNEGDTFGLVLIADGTFDEVSNEDLTSDSLLFSLPDANSNSQYQIARVLNQQDNTIISWEDTIARESSNKDYNDLVMSISGAQAINIRSISNLIGDDFNWLETEVGEDILNNFSNSDTNADI